MQYLVLIHNNADSSPTSEDWEAFLRKAVDSGMFRGGSAIGSRTRIGSKEVPDSTRTIGGYMRFDTDRPETLVQLLEKHPTVARGGSIELLELPVT